VSESEILVEQQPQQGVFICDHAGLESINSLILCEQVTVMKMAMKLFPYLPSRAPPPTLESSSGQIPSQSPTDTTSSRWY
jgi:hypothetical protein